MVSAASDHKPYRKETIKIGERSDGSSLVIPMITIEGKTEGPRLLVQAGAHGDEYTGIGAILKLLRTLDVSSLSGLLTLVPVLNTGAVDAMQRFSAFDGLDAAASYPGRSDGFLTERVANRIIEEIVKRADAVIDLHTSEAWGDAFGYVNCAPVSAPTGAESLEMARAFGFRWLGQPFELKEQTLLRPALAKHGIPSIGIELGGLGIWREQQVDAVCAGILNVMKYKGMIPGNPLPTDDQKILRNIRWVHASSGGFMTKVCDGGSTIPEGGMIAEIQDWFGETREIIRAPFNSVILIQRLRPVVRTGDEIALLGDLASAVDIAGN